MSDELPAPPKFRMYILVRVGAANGPKDSHP